MTTLIQAIQAIYQAQENCRVSGNEEWLARHGKTLKALYEMLPSGAGIDNGTTVVEISPERLKLSCGYHHMNDVGMYDGWTEHEIRVTPAWDSINVKVSGPNRNEILDYLHEVYHTCLTAEVLQSSDGQYHFTTER